MRVCDALGIDSEELFDGYGYGDGNGDGYGNGNGSSFCLDGGGWATESNGTDNDTRDEAGRIVIALVDERDALRSRVAADVQIGGEGDGSGNGPKE